MEQLGVSVGRSELKCGVPVVSASRATSHRVRGAQSRFAISTMSMWQRVGPETFA